MEEKRIEEMEDSIKMLAKYMKDELKRLDEMKASGNDKNVPKVHTVLQLAKELRTQRKMIEQLSEMTKKNTEFSVKLEQLEEAYGGEEDGPEEVGENVKELKDKLDELEETIGELEDLHDEDIKIEDKPKKKEKKVPKGEWHEDAVKFITKEMGEFAKKLDKKYPNLTTKDDFKRFEKEINEKIRTIEVPDMSIMENKIEVLEKKVEQLVFMVKSMYKKLPAIVE